MLLRIEGTAKTVEIEYLDENGIDCFRDLASANITYNEELENYTISQEDADWWKTYIIRKELFEEKLQEICFFKDLDYEKEEAKHLVEMAGIDMDSHISYWKNAIEELIGAHLKKEDELEEIGKGLIGTKVDEYLADTIKEDFQSVTDVFVENTEDEILAYEDHEEARILKLYKEDEEIVGYSVSL